MTPLAPTGERMSFYEPARQYDQKALQVIASVLMDVKAGFAWTGSCDPLSELHHNNKRHPGRSPRIVLDLADREVCASRRCPRLNLQIEPRPHPRGAACLSRHAEQPR